MSKLGPGDDGALRVLWEGAAYFKRHERYLAAIVLSYYGLIVVVAFAIASLPTGAQIQATVLGAAVRGLKEIFSEILTAYLENPPLAVAYTFAVNLFLGTMLYITLPGLVFFPLALVLALVRAVLWGVLVAPTSPTMILSSLISLPTLIFEGLGYILAVVPSTLIGISWLFPKRVFPEVEISRGEALKRELVAASKAYLWVVIVLLVAAVIEVTTVAIGFALA